MSKQNTEIVKAVNNEIAAFVGKRKDAILDYRKRKYDEKDFIKSAMVAISESDQLMQCLTNEKGRNSLYMALTRAARKGHSLNPQDKKACLVAYNNSVRYQILPDGLIDEAFETGKIKDGGITYGTVYDNDVFEIDKTLGKESYTFKPSIRDRGQPIGYYAALMLKNGDIRVEYMTSEQIEDHAQKYSTNYQYWLRTAPKDRKDTPWDKSREGMALKTILKVLLNRTKLSAEEYDFGDDDDRIINVSPVESLKTASSEQLLDELNGHTSNEMKVLPEKSNEDKPSNKIF